MQNVFCLKLISKFMGSNILDENKTDWKSYLKKNKPNKQACKYICGQVFLSSVSLSTTWIR